MKKKDHQRRRRWWCQEDGRAFHHLSSRFFFSFFFLILFRLFVVVSFHPSRPGRRVMERREWIESRWGCVNEVTRDVSLSLSLISLPPWPTWYTIGQKALSFFNLGFFPIESPRLWCVSFIIPPAPHSFPLSLSLPHIFIKHFFGTIQIQRTKFVF